jgi:hypothetical protein
VAPESITHSGVLFEIFELISAEAESEGAWEAINACTEAYAALALAGVEGVCLSFATSLAFSLRSRAYQVSRI